MFKVFGESDIYVTLTRTMTHQYKSFYNGLVVLCKNHYSSCLKKIRSRSDIKSKFNNLKILYDEIMTMFINQNKNKNN